VTPVLPAWALRFSAQRARGEWKLLAIITIVALIACSLITSLSVLVSATEQGGLRAELSNASNTSLDVTMIDPTADIATATDAAASAVATVLGPTASATLTSSVARSNIYKAPALADGSKTALGYVGEYSGIRDHTTLVAGEWPTAPGDIALPAAAADGFGLAVGDTVTFDVLDEPVTATIVATYAADDADESDFWDDDLLAGEGFNPQFPLPDSRVFVATNGFGPVLFAPGQLDTAGIPVERLDVSFQPDFSRFTVGELTSLASRLADSSQDVPGDMGDVASLVVFMTDLGETADAAASGLVITRSTVAATTLLLLVLAVAALAQTARLLFEARTDERRLMQLRGASRRQVLLLSLLEALAIGVVTAALGPIVAALVYRGLAAQGPMVDAGMPGEVAPSSGAFITSGVVAAVFVVILVAPLLRPSRIEAPRSSRQRRFSGLMSSGLDVGLVVLAAVAYWQLSSYRSPVTNSATLAIDPLLVAGPALVLLAGALLCVRFIPVGSRLLERIATRSRGTLFPLAAWEVGRRTQRAIAAVLLLTLALAVATFGLSFLASWKQSQVDQASLAIGAPLRVPVVQDSELAQAEGLGNSQPATRRQGNVGGPSVAPDGFNLPTGTAAVVMGLTPDARELIATGRAGDEGGAQLGSLETPVPETTGIELDGDVRGLSATVSTSEPIPGAALDVHAVLEHADGLLSTLELGAVPIDGRSATVSAEFTETPTGALRVVGFQFDTVVTDSVDHDSEADVAIDVLIGDVATLDGDELTPTTVADVPADGWFISSSSIYTGSPALTAPPRGAQFDLEVIIPGFIDAAVVHIVVTGWQPEGAIPGAMTTDLAHAMNVTEGELVYVITSNAAVPVRLDTLVPLVPGSGVGTVMSSQEQTVYGTVVVDQAALFRSLVVAGVSSLPLDEWWVDVPTGGADAFLADHADVPGIRSAMSAEVLARDLQQGPLRVATQAALWLAIVAAAVLAAIGFAVHTAATLRSRSIELAQLRAIGFTRRMLVGLVGAESALLATLGTVFGVAIGVLLGYLVGPLIAVSPTGRPTVPSVDAIIPWLGVALLVVELVAVLAIVVGVVARAQKGSNPANILRAGG
jgi:hypothetical protein